MLKIRLAWLWWSHVRHVLPWLRVIWLVDLTCERHEREFCTRPFKITELEKGRWSWISNCGETFHTDSWLAEANPGHSDRDAILKALLPGPRTVVLLGPGKARMGVNMPRAVSIPRQVYGIGINLSCTHRYTQSCAEGAVQAKRHRTEVPACPEGWGTWQSDLSWG